MCPIMRVGPSMLGEVGGLQGQGKLFAMARQLNERYELGPLLARGGMSEVLRAEDTVLHRHVAIKVLRSDGAPRAIARFEREAHVLARLQHPNIVTVFDAGTDRGDRYIVMELVDGPTLREILDRSGRLDPARAATITAEVANALAYAHERNVVHRDIKPSNVLITSGDHVKLADLGIAKLLSPDAAVTTAVLGTAQYISPEQARGDPVDGRADLYSLGCVLFEMLAGRPPFEGDAAALTYAHVHRPAPRVRSLEPAVPPALDALVASLLQKEPSARPQRAVDVRAALAGAGSRARSERITGGPKHRAPTSGRWVIPAIVAVVVGLVLLAAVPRLVADSDAGRGAVADAGTTSSATARTATTGSPATATEPLSPQEAAQHVFEVVGEGIAAGEVTGGIAGEVQHTMDEVFRDADEDQDAEKALEKITELQDKVTEALEKGEITSSARARAINDALEQLVAALGAQTGTEND